MKSLEKYLEALDSHLMGMDRDTKKEIIEELKTHVLESVRELGEINEENVATIIKDLEPPKRVATHYKEIYGYSKGFKILFILIATLTSILTIPSIPTLENWVIISTILFPMLTIYLVVVSIKAGKTTGLIAGTGSGITRITTYILLYTFYRKEIVIEDIALAGFIITSLILVLVGYLPGETKQKWKEKTGAP